MFKWIKPIAAAITAVSLVFGASAGSSAGLSVFAAASLKESLDEQARKFEGETGISIVVSYGGSNALAKQIEAGAPADVFISADLEWMDKLAMANPDSVPAGKYGKQALETLGIWASVEKKVARTENIRVALALVSHG